MKTGNEAKKSAFKYDEYSHGFDYLTFGLINQEKVAPFFTQRIESLDTDNSNFGVVQFVDEIFSIYKYKAPTGEAYQFSITYNSVSIPIFEITEFNSTISELSNSQWGVIHFYGAYFRLIELNYLSDELISTIQTLFLDSPVSRFDYRFDFGNTKEKVLVPLPDEVFPNLRANKKRKLYQSGKTLQSWELGNKTNKTIFIRLYDKLCELEGNLKKLYLYGDFDRFKSYIRLEYEFGKKFCNGYTGKDIEELTQKAFRVSGLKISSFTGNLYKPVEKLDLSDQISKLRYIKIFKSMGRNLHKNGIDPLDLIKQELGTLD